MKMFITNRRCTKEKVNGEEYPEVRYEADASRTFNKKKFCKETVYKEEIKMIIYEDKKT